MVRFILRRILISIPVIFGVALIVFTLFNLVGGDPTYQMLGVHASAETIQNLRHELGLDQSKPLQFVHYLKQIVTFDYGRSYVTKQNISEMIGAGMGPSFTLASTGFFITLVIGLGLSLWVSYFRKTWIDKTVVILCVLGMSVSALAFILAGQYYFAYRLGWFPISGYEPGFPERYAYVILPALIWVCVSVGVDVRFFRTCILDEIQQDYVRTARAKGLGEVKIFLKHILKNALIPILTYVVIQIPFLILGALLLESFFGIPGLGGITVDAFNNQDFPVMKAMTTLISIFIVVGNLVTDILYRIVDPRVILR